jgi:MOSC domain-containing protein YiiM
MFAIGPYEFTDQDVDTTLATGWALFDQLELRLAPESVTLIEPHRLTAEGVLDEVVAGTTSPQDGLVVFWGEWRAAMDTLRAHGALGGSETGTVTALFRSHGGVPKSPVDAVAVGWGGVVGDRQVNREHHGRPWQALCLWSDDVIDGFVAQGHPLAPGFAGENITVRGIDWAQARPGVRFRIGDVRAEVSSYAVPCRKNRDWFTGGRFDLMHHKHGPVSRLYATVLEPGAVSVGDPIVREP